MRFKAKKRYGEYKTSTCPFCSRQATNKNEQGLDVCHKHTKQSMEEFKCTCGSWLEIRSGKFGPYFNCINCGNFNYNKGMEIKSITMKDKAVKVKKELISASSPSISSHSSSLDTSSLHSSLSSYQTPSYSKSSSSISESHHLEGKEKKQDKRKEITITTDDVEYFS